MFDYNDVIKAMCRGERMISRRNAVFASEYQGRKYVLKIFTDDTARQTEESNLLFLSGAGIRVPKTAASFPCSLLLDFIPGKDFVSLITEAENSPEAESKIPIAAAGLAQWFKGFHSVTGLLKGDVNLRNFILTEDKKCVGLDFEDKFKKGLPEKDAGTILAYALSYEPMLTPTKLLFAKTFTEALKGYDKDVIMISYGEAVSEIKNRRMLSTEAVRRLMNVNF